MKHLSESSCRDVLQYSQDLLLVEEDCVQVKVTYKKIWDDGFGARGWKLNASIGDPEIIASTAETGKKINTSVFIHDILDHFLSGFGVSGHRSEAMALIQLSKRTGSDPRPDYEQMVKEDIINGRVNGEHLITFLPEELHSLLELDVGMSDKEIMISLQDKIGEKRLTDSLVENFFNLGKSGIRHANESWKILGLNPEKRTEIGLALQDILNRVDRIAEESGVDMFEASIAIGNEKCVFNIQDTLFSNSVHSANVA